MQRLACVLVLSALSFSEVAGGFTCPAAGSVGTYTRHAHPGDCRKYYICVKGVASEYGCPVGTVYKIGDTEGSGNCEDPEDVTGCEEYYGNLNLKSIRKSELLGGYETSTSKGISRGPKARRTRPTKDRNATTEATN